jgi:hypothetical protein
MKVIELEVTLEDVEPAVKRALIVPLNIQLDHLHDALQAALGWTNTHLYMIMSGGNTWSTLDPDYPNEDLNAEKYTLKQLIALTGSDSFDYIYDFGDGWEHCVSIGKAFDAIGTEVYPKLLSATGACPPEDIGGPPGYEDFLEVLADKEHPDYAEVMEWRNEEFNPNDAEEEALKENVHRVASALYGKATNVVPFSTS